MKKLWLVCIIVTLIIVLCACNIKNLFAKKIETPQPSVIGNIIYWSEIEGAEKYAVFCNNEQIAETIGVGYIAESSAENKQYHIVALGGDGFKDSSPSQKVVVYKSTQYSSEETMVISLENDREYLVPMNINYVTVSGSAQNTNIKIADRFSDLVILLQDVTLTSSHGKSCITTSDNDYSMTTKKYTVTLQCKGTNHLTGGIGYDAEGKPDTNSGKKGFNGEEGGSGIILPSLLLIGDGALYLQGADGGNGGTGADSSGLFSSAVYGKGGNGGNGGAGIKCTRMAMNMTNGGICSAYGGIGATGGKPGSNGSALTGPFYTAQWDSSYGSNGENGLSVTGSIIQCNGSLMGDFATSQVKAIAIN